MLPNSIVSCSISLDKVQLPLAAGAILLFLRFSLDIYLAFLTLLSLLSVGVSVTLSTPESKGLALRIREPTAKAYDIVTPSSGLSSPSLHLFLSCNLLQRRLALFLDCQRLVSFLFWLVAPFLLAPHAGSQSVGSPPRHLYVLYPRLCSITASNVKLKIEGPYLVEEVDVGPPTPIPRPITIITITTENVKPPLPKNTSLSNTSSSQVDDNSLESDNTSSSPPNLVGSMKLQHPLGLLVARFPFVHKTICGFVPTLHLVLSLPQAGNGIPSLCSPLLDTVEHLRFGI